MVHITGGGFPDNIPRVLGEGLDAVVHPSAWPWPPVFRFLATHGNVSEGEMLRVFNCGIGLVLIVPARNERLVKKRLDASGEAWYPVGRVQKGRRSVVFA
jgi:phosphoribosylformylglycinamidine cyclo-ligase